MKFYCQTISFRKWELWNIILKFSTEKCVLNCYFNRKKALSGETVVEMGETAFYPIQFCQLACKAEPQSIKATVKLNDNVDDLGVSVEINYGDNKIGKIKTSVINALSNTGIIIGTKGVLTVSWISSKTSS